jgi:hypothetical protein
MQASYEHWSKAAAVTAIAAEIDPAMLPVPYAISGLTNLDAAAPNRFGPEAA